MRLVKSHEPVYVQESQVVLNLILSYFVSPVPALTFKNLRDVGREITTEN